ncbi:MAG TPA: sugar nucleotide-binding protein [Planctomycetota bacterium]|nr:sugar nucleotide-binding protein [Planctomycetota bacterium]
MIPSLVVGADGLIGGALLRELRAQGSRVLGTTRRHGGSSRLDLAERPEAFLEDPALQELRRQGPWTAFLAAGITRFAPCTEDPVGTRRINVTNLVVLAKALVSAGAFLVYLSSSAIFSDGPVAPDELTSPSPTSEYGRQKADAERGLLDLEGGVAVVRLTKVVSATGRIGDWMETLRSGGAVEAAEDIRVAPLSLPFTVRCLIAVARAGRPGIYHLSGSAPITYFEFAGRLAASLGADPARVLRGTTGFQASSAPVLDIQDSTRYDFLPTQPVDAVLRDLAGDADL